MCIYNIIYLLIVIKQKMKIKYRYGPDILNIIIRSYI